MQDLIDSKSIKNNLELFSFPRLSGTEFEKKAFSLAKQKIEDMGLTPQVQTFKFSTFYSRVYPKIVFPILFWVFFTLFLDLNLLFVVLNLFSAFIIFIPFFIITRKPEKIRFGRVLESQNLYVKLSANLGKRESLEQKDIPNIFFMAHLDSKGQRITARVRGLSILSLMISLISLSIILVLRLILSVQLSLFFSYIGIVPLAMLLAVTLIFSLNSTNNNSKGVVDNASGVVCLLELLNYFSSLQNKIQKCNFWFVFTGAEESGTMGIRHFYQKLNTINPKSSYVNNFESLGKSVNVLISKSTRDNNLSYREYIADKAKEYGFQAMDNPFTLGIHTDGVYLLRKKFNSFEFGSTEVGKFMHSAKDSLENVDTVLMGKLCDFVIELSRYWES